MFIYIITILQFCDKHFKLIKLENQDMCFSFLIKILYFNNFQWILRFWDFEILIPVEFFQRSTQISKTFSPTTPLSTHQSIDLGELYNFVVGVEVNG